MSRIIPALVEHLLADATITAQLNGGVRWESEQGTDPEYPFITVEKISTYRPHSLVSATGIATVQVEVDALATAGNTADAIGDLIRESLDTFSGTMGTTNTAVVRSCILDGEESEPIKPNDASPDGIHRARLDFSITYTETIPSP